MYRNICVVCSTRHMQSTSVVCTHKIYKMYTWCCRGAATLGQLGYAGLHSGGAAIQGSCRKMVAWVRMTVSPNLKSIGLVWNLVQAVMGLHAMPLWLKIKIVSVACLCSLSFRFSISVFIVFCAVAEVTV